MDFGWSHPTAAAFIAHDTDNDVVYVNGEYYQTLATPQTHTVNLHALGADWIPGVCDPAGQSASQKDGESLLEAYARHGLELTKADNSREAGIQVLLERMQNGKFKVFSTCVNWLHEFRMYARDENGVPKKENDHLMDATRYAIMTGLGLARSKRSSDSREEYDDDDTVAC